MPYDRARTDLIAVAAATRVLTQVVARLDESSVRGPSLLPGWSRAHVVSHLARNADALVNLLTWARTGVEHPAYTSRADRDADIEEGSRRPASVLREDLTAACGRFEADAQRLDDRAWAASVSHPSGRAIVAAEVPGMRLFEVWTHLVDLDAGAGFDAAPGEHVDRLLDFAVRPHARPADGSGNGHRVALVVDLPGGGQRSWELASASTTSSSEIRGPAGAALLWLTGRGDGTGLSGDLPALAAWG